MLRLFRTSQKVRATQSQPFSADFTAEALILQSVSGRGPVTDGMSRIYCGGAVVESTRRTVVMVVVKESFGRP